MNICTGRELNNLTFIPKQNTKMQVFRFYFLRNNIVLSNCFANY